ncbi:MAG: glycosyltransferase [Marinoscillum sp.]
MKVLHICSEHSWGGGEKQAMQLVEGTNRRGIESLVFCKSGSAVADYCVNSGIQNFTDSFKSAYSITTIVRLVQLIRSTKPDMIHMHSSKAHTVGLFASLFCKTPLVLSRRVHSPVKNNLFSRWKYNHPNIKKIICVSQAVERLLSVSIRNPVKLTTIYGGIDLETTISRYQPDYLQDLYSIKDSEVVIGFMGSLNDIKDPLTFVEICAELSEKQNNLKCVLIGEGPMRKQIEQRILQRNLTGQVILTGFTHKNPEALSSLDMLVLCSKSEGFPNVILEAAALQVPVVATDVGGIREFIDHGLTGLLSSPGDRNQLIANCERLLHDQLLRQSVIDNAHLKVENFSHDQGLDQTIELYREVINQ